MDEIFIHISIRFKIRELFMSQAQESQSATIDIKTSSRGNFEKTLYVNLTIFSRKRFDSIFQVLLPASIALIGLWAFLSLHHIFYLLIFVTVGYYLYKSTAFWQKIEIHNEQIIAKPLIGHQKNYFANNISRNSAYHI
jgi:putative lipoic acid-binding regulatory protein